MTGAAQSSGRKVTARARTVTWLVVLVLSAANFGIAHIHMGQAQLPVALVFAVANAVLIVVFFMDLLEERGARRFALPLSVAWLLLLLGLVLLDVSTRYPPVQPAHAREPVPETRPAPTRAPREHVGSPLPHHLPYPDSP